MGPIIPRPPVTGPVVVSNLPMWVYDGGTFPTENPTPFSTTIVAGKGTFSVKANSVDIIKPNEALPPVHSLGGYIDVKYTLKPGAAPTVKKYQLVVIRGFFLPGAVLSDGKVNLGGIRIPELYSASPAPSFGYETAPPISGKLGLMNGEGDTSKNNGAWVTRSSTVNQSADIIFIFGARCSQPAGPKGSWLDSMYFAFRVSITQGYFVPSKFSVDGVYGSGNPIEVYYLDEVYK